MTAETTVITEQWLQHQAIQNTVQRLAQTACEALFGPNRVTVSNIQRTEDDKWTGRCDVWAHGYHDWTEWDITFEGQSYVDGGVKVDHCTTPQTSPATTTGKYILLDNRDDSQPVERKITISESDTTEVQTTLSEGVELKSGQSAEAGAGPAKFSASFEETFSITKGSMNDKSHTSSTSDELEEDVLEHDAIGIVYTQQPSLSECFVRIGAAIDWTSIRFHVEALEDPRYAFGHSLHAGWYPNWKTLEAQPRAIRESGGKHEYANIECTGLEDWVSWMQGHNPRQTRPLILSAWSKAALEWLAGKRNRVDFAGKQQHSSMVTSYVIHEIPGDVSKDDARTAMSKAGQDPEKVF